MAQTKLCKHCKTEIDKKAKICPNCKKKQPNKVKIALIVIGVVFVLSLLSETEETPNNESDNTEANVTESAEENANKLVSISAEYEGNTEAGTVINNKSDFIVTANYENGETEKLSQWLDGWELAEEHTLAAEELYTATINYEGLSCQVQIQCTTLSEANYKNQCTTVSYEELARYPDQYKGQKICMNVKVFQIVDEGKKVNKYLSEVNEDEYGFWSDFLYFECPAGASTRILENDVVTIYGEYQGLYDYTTVLGSGNSVPHINAEYVDFLYSDK